MGTAVTPGLTKTCDDEFIMMRLAISAGYGVSAVELLFSSSSALGR